MLLVVGVVTVRLLLSALGGFGGVWGEEGLGGWGTGGGDGGLLFMTPCLHFYAWAMCSNGEVVHARINYFNHFPY